MIFVLYKKKSFWISIVGFYDICQLKIEAMIISDLFQRYLATKLHVYRLTAYSFY
jgi:hypothetical protein